MRAFSYFITLWIAFASGNFSSHLHADPHSQKSSISRAISKPLKAIRKKISKIKKKLFNNKKKTSQDPKKTESTQQTSKKVEATEETCTIVTKPSGNIVQRCCTKVKEMSGKIVEKAVGTCTEKIVTQALKQAANNKEAI